MEDILSFLPREIVSQIMQYTYHVQDKSLLSDIVNYTQSKSRLVFLYLTYFTIREQVDEYESWLSNDIAYYMNEFCHTDVFYGGKQVVVNRQLVNQE